MARSCTRHGRRRSDRAVVAALGSELHCLQLDAAEYLAEHRHGLPPTLAAQLERLAGEPSPSDLTGASDLMVRLDLVMRAADDALCRAPHA